MAPRGLATRYAEWIVACIRTLEPAWSVADGDMASGRGRGMSGMDPGEGSHASGRAVHPAGGRDDDAGPRRGGAGRAAAEELLPLVYDELRRLAAAHLAGRRPARP